MYLQNDNLLVRNFVGVREQSTGTEVLTQAIFPCYQ